MDTEIMWFIINFVDYVHIRKGEQTLLRRQQDKANRDDIGNAWDNSSFFFCL